MPRIFNVSPWGMGLLILCFIFVDLSSAQETPPASPPEPEKLYLLSLQEAIENTLKNNVAIAVQEFNAKIKEQTITEKRGDFDPELALELSVKEQTRQTNSAFSAPFKSRNNDHGWDLGLSGKAVTGTEYDLNWTNDRNKTNSAFVGLNPNYRSELTFSLTQPLLKNFGIDVNKREIYIATNDVKISDYDFEKSVIDIITDAENVYWDLVFTIEDLKVQEKSLERARDLERRVKAQVDVGTMAPLEILQAQAEVASREELLLVARDAIQDNEDNLKNIMNVSFDSPAGMKEIVPSDRPPFQPDIDHDLALALKEALTHRPDYLAKKKELDNQNILVKFNENQVYPSVDLFGSLGLNGLSGTRTSGGGGAVTSANPFAGNYEESLSNLFATKYFLWEAGIKFSYPLGNRAAKSRLTAARLETAQLLLDIKDLEKSIVVEVREAVRQVQTDIKRVQSARLARKLAEEKLEAEEKKFEVGLSTSFEVLEFQEDLAEEQSKEIKAIIDYNKSLNRLHQVTARTLEVHNIKLFSKDNS